MNDLKNPQVRAAPAQPQPQPKPLQRDANGIGVVGWIVVASCTLLAFTTGTGMLNGQAAIVPSLFAPLENPTTSMVEARTIAKPDYQNIIAFLVSENSIFKEKVESLRTTCKGKLRVSEITASFEKYNIIEKEVERLRTTSKVKPDDHKMMEWLLSKTQVREALVERMRTTCTLNEPPSGREDKKEEEGESWLRWVAGWVVHILLFFFFCTVAPKKKPAVAPKQKPIVAPKQKPTIAQLLDELRRINLGELPIREELRAELRDALRNNRDDVELRMKIWVCVF